MADRPTLANLAHEALVARGVHFWSPDSTMSCWSDFRWVDGFEDMPRTLISLDRMVRLQLDGQIIHGVTNVPWPNDQRRTVVELFTINLADPQSFDLVIAALIVHFTTILGYEYAVNATCLDQYWPGALSKPAHLPQAPTKGD